MELTKTIGELETNYEWELKYKELEDKISVAMVALDETIEKTNQLYREMQESLDIVKSELWNTTNKLPF